MGCCMEAAAGAAVIGMNWGVAMLAADLVSMLHDEDFRRFTGFVLEFGFFGLGAEDAHEEGVVNSE